MFHLEDRDNPYPGLRPFDEADAGDFLGRESLVEAHAARNVELRRLSDEAHLGELAREPRPTLRKRVIAWGREVARR